MSTSTVCYSQLLQTLTTLFQSHGWTGAAGHMGNVPVASFDPLFFLHHW
ncbi:MAG: tyrosinase family protein [Acinetobacter pittii]|nr:tyrosinase family protein [Acinetobacter pittii]